MKPINLIFDIKRDMHDYVELMQGYSYYFECEFYDDGIELDLSGYNMSVDMLLANGDYDFRINSKVVSGNKVTFNTNVISDYTGDVKLQILLEKSGVYTGSWLVGCKVKPSVLNEVKNTDFVTDLKQTIKEGKDLYDKGGVATKQDIAEVNNQLFKKVNVATFEERKIFSFVDVRDFGAVGDGITDDSEAIQNAIDYCLKNARDLVFGGSGTYCISKPIEIIPIDSVEPLPGEYIHFSIIKVINITASNGARIKAISEMDSMIKVESKHSIGTLGSWYFKADGITLDGNDKAKIGIYLNYIFHSNIENCRIFRVETGINSYTSVGTTIQRCVISAKNCIHIPTGGDGWVKFNDLYPTENGRAIWLGGYAGNYHILDNVISANVDNGYTMGVFIDGTYLTTEGVNWPVAMVNVSGNEFSSCICAIKCVGLSDVNKSVWGVNIVNNHFTLSFDKIKNSICIELFACFDVNISDNYINTHRCSEQNIGVKLTHCDGVSIKNNKFDNIISNAIDCYNSTKTRIVSNEFWNFGKSNSDLSAILFRGILCNSNFVESNLYRNDLNTYGQYAIVESLGADYNISKNEIFINNVTGYGDSSANSIFKREEFLTSIPLSTVGYKNGDIITLKTPLSNGAYGAVLKNDVWVNLI